MQIFLLGVLGFLICLAVVVALRPLCVSIGHVDNPGGRKRHTTVTPLSGGVAITATICSLGVLVSFSTHFEGFAFGVLLLVILGAMDDRRHVPAMVRLAFQTAAVAFGMCALGGVTLANLGDLFGNGDIYLGHWSVAFTVFAVVGLINAVNMIDGIDGLAGSFAVLVLSMLLGLAAMSSGSIDLVLLSVSVGAIAGFLTMNLRLPWQTQARAFLGDAGSLVLGFMLGWFVIRSSQGGQAIIRPITAVWLLGLPLMDTCYLMASRVMKGKSPFAADRTHFHHLLARLGFGPVGTLYLWLATAAILGVIGLLGEWCDIAPVVMSVGFVGTFAAYCLANMLVWRFVSSARGLKAVRAFVRWRRMVEPSR